MGIFKLVAVISLSLAAISDAATLGRPGRTIVVPSYTEAEMDAWFASKGLDGMPETRNQTEAGKGPPTRTRVPPADKRQTSCYTTLVPDGNGNPHQNYQHQQVSDTDPCSQDADGNFDCGISYSTSYSYTWSASIGVTDEFISGGFSVSESWSSGDSYTCNPLDGDDGICMWYSSANTAYTVEDIEVSSGGEGECATGDPYVITAPNTNNAGGGPYCVHGIKYCRANGDFYWDLDGPATGPPS